MDLYSSSPDLGIPSPILLQHFYLGLSEESTQFLDITLGGAFLHLSDGEGRVILDTILENSPYTDVHDDSPKEKDIPIPTQEEVSIAESLPIPSKALSANPRPEPFLGTPKEEEIHPMVFPFEFKEDLWHHWPQIIIFTIHLIIWLSKSPSNQHHLPPQISISPMSLLVSLVIIQTKEAF